MLLWESMWKIWIRVLVSIFMGGSLSESHNSYRRWFFFTMISYLNNSTIFQEVFWFFSSLSYIVGGLTQKRECVHDIDNCGTTKQFICWVNGQCYESQPECVQECHHDLIDFTTIKVKPWDEATINQWISWFYQ